jgi:hypothetical protein
VFGSKDDKVYILTQRTDLETLVTVYVSKEAALKGAANVVIAGMNTVPSLKVRDTLMNLIEIGRFYDAVEEWNSYWQDAGFVTGIFVDSAELIQDVDLLSPPESEPAVLPMAPRKRRKAGK